MKQKKLIIPIQTNKSINFSELWDKLKNRKKGDCFTTIRSYGYLKSHKLRIGDVVNITLKRKEILFRAIIYNVEEKQIIQIPLDLLQKDIAPDLCFSHQMFVNKLNDFYKKIGIKYASNSLETQKTIIYLRVV